MLVTLITDASLCHETRAAGFGWWAVSRRGRAYGGGPIHARPESSNAAELMAIVNGMHCALRRGILLDGDALIVQTDSQAAIQAINGARTIAHHETAALERLRAYITAHALSIEMRHVKGHTRTQDKRSYVNRVCDMHARSAMRRLRHELRHGAALIA